MTEKLIDQCHSWVNSWSDPPRVVEWETHWLTISWVIGSLIQHQVVMKEKWQIVDTGSRYSCLPACGVLSVDACLPAENLVFPKREVEKLVPLELHPCWDTLVLWFAHCPFGLIGSYSKPRKSPNQSSFNGLWSGRSLSKVSQSLNFAQPKSS